VIDEQVVVAIRLHTCIPDVLGFSLGRDISYPEFIRGSPQLL
jgi:hypothetical protein